MAVDLTRIGQFHVGLVALAGSVAYATRWFDALSLVLGGVVMGANFWLLRVMARLLLPTAERTRAARRAALGVAAMTLKLGLFIALLAALFWRLPIDGMSFALGVTLLLVACLLEVARHEMASAQGVG